jgi:hypothetical protein
MKIPIYDEPQVSTAPLATPLDTTDRSGAWRAVAGIGQSLGARVDKLHDDDEAMLKKQRSQDDAASVLAAENSLHKDVDMAMNDRDIGLLNQQGEKAVAMSAHIYDRLETMREQKIQQFGLSPEQAQTFKLRSAGMLEDTYRQGETYVAHQRRASNQADVDAAQTLTLNSIAQFSNDDELVARNTARVESGIRSQAISPQAGDAAVAEWRGKVAQTVLNSRISGRDVEGAKAYFDQPDVRASLGPAAAHYEKTIQLLGDQAAGVKDANSIVDAARRPVTGFVDQSAVMDALSKVAPGPRRQLVEEELRRQLTIAHQAETQKKADWFNTALSSYYLAGKNPLAVPTETAVTMEQYDPDGWHKFQSIVHEDQAHSRAGKTAVNVEQLGSFTTLINDMATRPEAYKDMDEKLFQRAHLAEVGPKFYLQAAERLAALKKTPVKELSLTGMPEQVVRESTSAVFGEPKDDWTKWSPEHQAYFHVVQDGVQKDADAWSKAHHGQRPTLEQYEAWTKVRVKPVELESGHWYQPNKKVPLVQYQNDPALRGKQVKGEPAADGVPAPPQSGPRAPTGYRYTKNRKQRKPVFSDGTEGPAESVDGG